jgi:hypothetical protein
LPDSELGLELAASCALLAMSAKPTDREPTTAVVRKSRRETVINASVKIERWKAFARIARAEKQA